MRKIGALVRRELIAYFSSPMAYIVLTAFLLLQGYIFYLVLAFINDPMAPPNAPLHYFFGDTIFFWLFLLFVVPVITMRLIAEERRSGTIEVLLTSPLTETQVIAGKFLAALAFYVVLWLPTVVYVLILEAHSDVDPGPVLSGYLGVFLLGFLFLAVGTFTSTLTTNQLIAAVIAFAAIILLFSIGLVEHLLISSSWLKAAVGHMNVWTHMDDFKRGIVDSRHVVYLLSSGLLFLFFAVKSLEVKKWR